MTNNDGKAPATKIIETPPEKKKSVEIKSNPVTKDLPKKTVEVKSNPVTTPVPEIVKPTPKPINFTCPRTNFEFERDWKTYKGRSDDNLYQYFQVRKKIMTWNFLLGGLILF